MSYARGEFTSYDRRELDENIDVLAKQSKGIFFSQDHRDFLIETIGTEDNHRRVYGLGRGVGFKLYFGSSQSSIEVNRKREIEEIIIVDLGEGGDKWIHEELRNVQMEE
ncbi:uncharacterized protein LOC131599728 [Vicia villosa]|uniref:uncharacterized protein LOC131599728 n=1 Tax=Vicia villosa TaxID=3911 RepID=UPI00273CE06A|nr:uncharacterized protein LOC131599728 [Vicia villosa]